MNELDAIKARREAISHMVRDTTTRRATAYDAQATAAFIAAAPADVDTLLAMVERLTARAEEAEALLAGSPADTLAWALDKREQELREARCEVERLTGENANAKAALVAAAALLHQSNAEVERLTGELARLRNGGKPEPTQEENDAAQERLRQMDVLHARHGNNTSTWPDYALEHYNRLQGAQNDYEAKYC